MTFFPEQIVENDEWQSKHKGHKIEEQVDEYPLDEGKAIKRMCYWRCITCGARHLYNMETVEVNNKGEK
ncbi:MAG: hypothetical protein ACTSW7_00775 [Candidatus Thorarchaeota archaeon]|nr:hypothetical protein [Thermoplasmatales archaeon]